MIPTQFDDPDDHRFHISLDHLLKMEGGYVNDPDDPGGETKYGISKRSYPNEDIRHLTKRRAAQIYQKDYWDLCRCDDLPWPVNGALFDAAVNHGRSRAVKMLQKTVGARPDGVIGVKTIFQVMAMDEDECCARFLARRAKFYSDLAKRGNNKKFLKGWLYRLFSLSSHLSTAS